MNILYIAYSCSPNYGSEDAIGWNVPVEASKTSQVYVITKEEHRREIQQYLSQNNIESIKFYFADIPSTIKGLVKKCHT